MASFSRQLIYKIYNESGTYLGLLDDVVSDFSIEKTINGGDSEFKFSLSRKFDDFDENTTIKFNNRVKVYLKDEYNLLGDKLIAYGYIVAYSPFLRGKEEGVEVTCLSAVSKLSNDFYRTGNSLDASELGIELTSQRADQMMEAIIDHYRSIETNSMLSNDYTNSDSTTDNDGTITTFTHRFFNMKHLDALREASKFLPKNKSGGYWFYWRIDTDGKLWVKNISTTANHSFKIGKHIKEISGDKSMIDVVNRVYFWNEKGTSDPDYIKLTNDDSTSQTAHDIMSDYLTDSKITNSTAASLLTSSRLKDGKDPKLTIKITLTGDYDLSSIKPGQTCKILNAKNNPYQVGSDAVLLIESIEYSVDSAVLSLSNGHVSFSDMIEEERQLLDKHMTWFGYITQRLTAAQLGPANRTWSTDIIFSATSGADAYRQVDWTTGIIYIPAGASGTIGKRNIAANNTTTVLGTYMSATTDYYIYLDEETFNTSAANSDSGTGIIKQGGEVLGDASKAWTTDQYKGYIVTIGGQTRIIRSNTATVLTLEDRWTIADTTGAYTIKKMSFNVTSNKETASKVSTVIFSNVRVNSNTASDATVVPTSGSSSTTNYVLDGTQNIAYKSITADSISATYIYAGTIDADQINVGTLTGFEIQTATTGYRLIMSGANNAYEFRYNSTLLAKLESIIVPDTGFGGAALVHGTGSILLGISGEGIGIGDRAITMQDSTGSQYFQFYDNDGGVCEVKCNVETTIFNNLGVTLDLSVTGTIFSATSISSSGTVTGSNLSGTNTGDSSGHSGLAALSGASFTGATETNGSNAHLSVSGNAFLRIKSMTGSTASGLTGAQNGAIYYRSDDHIPRMYVNGAWYSILTSYRAQLPVGTDLY